MMSRLVGLVVVVFLAVVPSAEAAIGIRVDQKLAVVGASLHVTAFGPDLVTADRANNANRR